MKVTKSNTGKNTATLDPTSSDHALFESCVNKIDTFYKENEFSLGWRFLSCSSALLKSNPKVALITLNPGGDRIPADHPWASCEEYNPYRDESWGTSRPGQHTLQIQVQRMFEKLRIALGSDLNPKDFMDQALCGHFIPFRSPRFNDLPCKPEAISFGYSLWEDIFTSIKPQFIVCIDRETYKHISKLIPLAYGLPLNSKQTVPTGWGNYMADIDGFGDNNQVRLLRLPHLSTFQLFTSSKCAPAIDQLFRKLN